MKYSYIPDGAQILVPFAELIEHIRAVVRQEIHSKHDDELQARYLSPDQTRKLFNPQVSLVTLNQWAKKGLLNKHYINSRTYYKYTEVIEAVKHLKRYTR